MTRYSRQHYVDVARVLRWVDNQAPASSTKDDVLRALRVEFGRLFSNDNSHFSYDRFSKAARVNIEK